MSVKTMIAAVVWLVVVGGVMGWTMVQSSAPGPAGTAPADWPAESRLSRQPGRPVLVLFAHPRCPCTRASLGELAKITAQHPADHETWVVFLKPEGTGADWAETDLWRTAAAIPGVRVHQDESGEEARRFGAETSGQTLFYDAGGHLRFHGGITLSRGHAGDNAGADAIGALLQAQPSAQPATPVFGCALFEPACAERSDLCRTNR